MSYFVLKIEFDFNIKHSKNRHLAFIWFIFSLKPPCKCVSFFSSFYSKGIMRKWAWTILLSIWFVYLSTLHKLSLKQKCLFPPSPSRGISKELKEVIAGQYAVSEGATGNCIFFSSVNVWIIFVTGIMWLIYIVSVLLWSSKHFMATLVNPKALLWARYLTAFVLIWWSGRL